MLGVIRLSRAAYRKMLQNLAWGAGYNLAAIPLAAGVLAWAGVTLSPAIGAILMSVSTVVVGRTAGPPPHQDGARPARRHEAHVRR